MIPIATLSKKQFRNNDHFQYYTEVIELIKRTGAEKLKIESQFNDMLEAYNLEDAALIKITKSVLTQDIKQLDKRRDTALAAINDKLKIAHKHFDAEVRNAAQRLKIVVDTYGAIARKSLNEQTSAVYNLLQELQGKYSQDTQKVEISGWITELETSNTALSHSMRERRDEAIERRPEVSAATARKMLDNAYNVILKRINALITLEGDANYKEFTTSVNKLTTDFKNVISQRTAKASKAAKQVTGNK